MEIIKRKNEADIEMIDTKEGTSMQIAYNNYGHISLRFIQEDSDKDILIVLNTNESYALKDFISRYLR